MNQNETQHHLHRLSQAILFGFLAIILALVFWSVARAPSILAREDNPRLVEAELRLQRGTILDRHGAILAQTTGEADQLSRVYPLPNIGPAVGYYSFRHGTAGIEEGYDAVLRGEEDDIADVWRRQLLHQPQVGRDVRLTLDADLQETADFLLADYQGAALVLDVTTGEILAMVSHPGYDPNQLDEQFEALVADETAPLLNRAAQGQYQPGLALQPFILAAALDQNLITLNETVPHPNRAVLIDSQTKQCTTSPPASASWADVLRHRCPGPMQDLADQMGLTGLDVIFADFGLTISPTLPLNSDIPPPEPLTDPLLAGIGQDTLTVTPLQVGLALAALGNDGRLPQPHLVTAVQNNDGEWQDVITETVSLDVVSGRTARSVRQVLAEENSIHTSVLALAGPEGNRNGWFLGLTPAGTPQTAVVVVLEGVEDVTLVEEAGLELLTAVKRTTN